ncbi:MAG: hypothetical protein ACYC23_22010, partial [Limisphaerales bacterium]
MAARARFHRNIGLAQAPQFGSLGGPQKRASSDLFVNLPKFHVVGFMLGTQPADLLFKRRAFA